MTEPSFITNIPGLPARRLAFDVLKEIYRGGYADVVLHRSLQQSSLSEVDRQFTTELVYGTVRRQRTLDGLIDQLGRKKARQQPLELRIVLHLGLYQLRYLNQVPPSAAVNTSVDLVKTLRMGKLSGVVNGILRQYRRLQETIPEPLQLPDAAVPALALRHSYPDWIVELWQQQLGLEAADALCQWFNRPPTIDLRVNPLKISRQELAQKFLTAGIETQQLPHLPHLLRLVKHVGAIRQLPGYTEGWWSVQDASAQLVGSLVNPQPGEVVIDACAAPGGKTTHL
ncbi:MAG: transcription antitermination factor NusB, partial [Cyanobacteria bacterium P01_H01_bin.58]